ncbi:HlyD family efflux transporter periplasmic adaptor subunit [Blautia sp. MSJ-19]|uniref:HlyD family efflux transporter periplasmic adaptor subunit n=1 Tax=Blautia sp. MSJ-19 TaxID=2841517 RepID=UPI001C0F24BA|nr:biotin/lipoyl-binding protein [Blautia sp. MSJ-19]MBU5480064.1 biotin/lipoyl-binding protein [Blautia sp. MSJ-19]
MFGKRQKENKSKGNKKKGRKKKVIAAVVTVAVLGTAGTVVYSKTQKQNGDHPETKEAKSTEVTLGNISNTIVGTGNLELDEAQAVTIPSGLTVSEVYVESGDQVSAGTVLASVDKSSVLSAVKTVQEEISELDEKISECQSDSTANTVSSTVSGRVKAIYVASDSEVTDVMVDKGALMELSLDGLMAVKLESVTGVTAGDTVTVTLSDGSSVSGTVESTEENTCIVTVTDNGTTLGDTVTVTDADGNTIGSGNLYIHEAFEITGTTGTVASVSVSENEKVTSGEELLVLNGAESDSEYEELMATREARTATLKKLLSLTKNPQITADQDGTIQDVNVSTSQTTDTSTSSGTSGNTGVSQMAYTRAVNNTAGNNGISFQKLSFDDGTNEADVQTFSEPVITSGEAESSSDGQGADVMPVDTEICFTVVNEGASDSSQAVITAPVKGAAPITEINASDGSYRGVITWNPNDSTFAADTAYQALVLLSASDGYCFNTDSVQGTAIGTISGIQVTDNGKTLEFQIAFPQTASDNADDKKENDDSKTNNSGDTGTTTENGGTNNSSQSNVSSENNQNTGTASNSTQNSSDNTASGNAGGTGQTAASSSGSGGTSAQQGTETSDSSESSSKTESSQYSTDVTAFTISPDENMCLSVSVDELDINSVEKGQTAVVTFDAIEDKEFEGEVTKIGSTASVSGGVAKYTVEITIPRDDEMKQGMNASATITIDERDQVLTLPMNALQEQGDRTFVYTEQEADGTLSGEVEIQTGLTDGNTVEITDGLEEGDTVYYMRSESSQTNSSSNGMPDMSGGPSGDMPDMSGFGGNSDGNSGGGPDGNAGGGPDGGQGGPGM